jgi:hypothetical protein
MVDTIGGDLLAQLFASASHLRPLDADLAALQDKGGLPQVCGLSVQFGPDHPEPTIQSWVFDGEGRTITAHGQMERALHMAEPHRRALALQTHLSVHAPLVLANGLDISWITALRDADRFELRLHHRNRTLSAYSAAQLADHFGQILGVLSGFAPGTRSFSIEPKGGMGTRTVVAANAVDAAKFWMVMESLDVLRFRPVQPPAWVIEKHPMDTLDDALRAFGNGLADMRIVHRR